MTRDRKHAHPLTAQQRHQKGHDLAMANLRKNGSDALRDNLRGGFMHRFERQVDADDATLRARDPAAYQARVQAALTAHMQTLAAHSVASRAAKHAARDSGGTA